MLNVIYCIITPRLLGGYQMAKIKSFFAKRHTIKTSVSILLIIILSGIVTIAMLIVQTNGLADIYNLTVQSRLLMPILNYLPVLLIMLCMYFATSSVAVSGGVVSLLMLILAIVNRYKILFRNDPFLPWDIVLGGEALGVVGDFSSNLILAAVLAALFSIALIIIAAVKLKSRKLPAAARIAGALACIVVAFICNGTIYRSEAINGGLPIRGTEFNKVDVFNSKGWLYSFIYSANVDKLSKPDYYDAASVKDAIASAGAVDPADIPEDDKPHIIMIMGESFSDISESDAISFDGYTDPLANYKAIIQSENAISGTLITPSVGGGTADTEFDVLTGLASRNLRGVSYSFRLVRRGFESINSVLERVGYASVGMHPGAPWFYNRENVYEYLGFDEILFFSDFDYHAKGSAYLSEVATINKVIEVFEEHLADNPDTPLFEFCVTIQNHGGYANKYFEEGINFNTDLDLTDTEANLLANFFDGQIDADRELARLVEYLEALDEPVVLVYFGDHIPSLTLDLYDMLIPNNAEDGSLERMTRLYRTPYLIWQNSAAAASTKINENAETSEMREDFIISSNYLGGYVLELLGFDKVSPYFSYANYIRTLFPVVLESRAFDMNDNPSDNAGGAAREALILFRNWMYYKVFDE